MGDGFEDVVASRLRRLGQRLTPRRRRLLDVLARAGQPLTITEIQLSGMASGAMNADVSRIRAANGDLARTRSNTICQVALTVWR